MLEDHADLAARLAQPIGIECGQFLARHRDGARGRLVQQVDDAHQRALASAAAANDAEDLAAVDGQVDVAQRVDVVAARPPKVLRYPLEFNHAYMQKRQLTKPNGLQRGCRLFYRWNEALV